MEWLPPSTKDTVGLLKEAIISAMARPASSPHCIDKYQQSVNLRTILYGCQLWQDMFVFCGFIMLGRHSWPSISPIIDNKCILCSFLLFSRTV